MRDMLPPGYLAIDARLWAAYPQTSIARRRDGYVVDGEGVATIAVEGPLSVGDEMAAYFDGGTAYSQIRRFLDQAEADKSVRAIVMRITDSPGGMVAGLFDTAAAVRSSSKPIGAYVEGSAASAAYMLAAAAPLVYASPSAMVGSVGVVSSMVDRTGLEQAIGVKRIEVTSSDAPLKRIDPTAEDGQAVMRAEADALSEVLSKQIAQHRGVKLSDVRASFGKGGMLIAKDARAAGMIDAVGSETDLRSKLLSRRAGGGGAMAMDEDKLREALAAREKDLAQLVAALGCSDVPSAMGAAAALRECKVQLAAQQAQLDAVRAQEQARAQADRDASVRNLLAEAVADGRLLAAQQAYLTDRAKAAGATLTFSPLARAGGGDAAAAFANQAAHVTGSNAAGAYFSVAIAGASDALAAEIAGYVRHLQPIKQPLVNEQTVAGGSDKVNAWAAEMARRAGVDVKYIEAQLGKAVH